MAEVIDKEVDGALGTLVQHPLYAAARLLQFAEREYYTRAAGEGSRDLSLEVLQPIVASVGDIDAYSETLQRFALDHDAKLSTLLRAHADDAVNILLSQPEVVILYERSLNGPYLLEDALRGTVPEDWLEQVRDAWGHQI